MQHGQEVFEKQVGLFQSPRIACGIAPVAVEHVEIDQIGEDQAARAGLRQFHNLLLRCVGGVGVKRACQAAMGKNIFDFTNAGDRHARRLQAVEHGRLGQGIGIVAAVFGALEGAGPAHKRTGNHPPDLVRIAERAGGFASAVQFAQGDYFLMGRDLKNRIGAGINDPGAFAHLARAQFLDDRGAAGGPVADEAPPGAGLESRHQFRREGRRAFGKQVKPARQFKPRDFPVAGGRVFALRYFPQGAIAGQRFFRRRNSANRRPIRNQCRNVAEPQALEGGQPDSARRFRQVREGVGAGVAILGRIRRRADPDGIQDDQDCFHEFQR